MKSFLLFIACMIIYFAGFSQEKASIKGKVTDSLSGERLDQATVLLIRLADRVIRQQAVSGKNGFEFRHVSSGNYLLAVSFVGYRPDSIQIGIHNPDSLYNADIKMVKLTDNLVEVVVKSVIPPVIIKNDTIVYNTNTVKTLPNATIEDLIKKLPGMEVDKDGNITLHGQKVDKIYVDGKEFFLNDPKLATRNLTADMVDAIEAFDNQRDRSRFTGIREMNVNKALNLRLKKDKKNGFYGNMMARAGTTHVYSGNATATWFKGDRWTFGNFSGNHVDNLVQGSGLKRSAANQALNYRNNIGSKVQLIANYNATSNVNQSGQTYRRETFLGDSSLIQSRNAFTNNQAANHDFIFNVTYNVDSLNSVVYNQSVSWQQKEIRDRDSSFIFLEKNGSRDLSNTGQTMNQVSLHGSNFINNIIYRRLFRKKGRSFYGEVFQSRQQQTQDGNLYSVINSYDNTGLVVDNSSIDQRFHQRIINDNYQVHLSYTEPLTPNQVIDLGYSLNISSGKSGKDALNYNPSTHNYDLPDSLVTNNFTNNLTQQNFSIGYNYLGRRVQYQLGVSMLAGFMENESRNHHYTAISQHTVNWSPRASAFYSLARQKNLQVQYNGNSMAPTTEMLQPVPDLSNPFLVKAGNPGLKQQFQHQLYLNYNKSDSKNFSNLSLQFGSDYTTNRIVQSATISSAGIQELMYVNASGVYSLNSRFNYGFALNKTRHGGGGISTWIQYNRDISFINGEENVRHGFACGQAVNINYHSDDKIFAGLSAAVSYNHSHYSIGTDLNTGLFTQKYSANIVYMLPCKIRATSDFIFQMSSKQGNLPGTSVVVWNASLLMNIFRNNQGEIGLSGSDLLKTNKGISQAADANYIETRENAVLQRYFMLSLRYNFRSGAK